MGIAKILLPTPGKLLFMALLSPLIFLLLLAVGGFLFAITTFPFLIILILAVAISYVLVSIVYEVFKKALVILVAIWLAALLFSWVGLSLDPVKYTVNTVVNNNFNEVDTSCVVDADCSISSVTCEVCPGLSDLQAVNAEWEAWCPFSYDDVNCEPLPELNATCAGGQCQIQQVEQEQ